MLTWLVSTSIRLRWVLLALCVVMMYFGYRSLQRAPLDVFPEFAPPLVEVQTEAPGLSSEQVEALVTMPLENALTGLPGVKTVRSKSVLGLSQVVLVLGHGTDHLKVRQLVQERLASESRQLPSVAKPPVILQPLSSTSRVMKIGLWSDSLDQRQMTLLAMWTIRPKLMSLPGVANVAIWGQRDTQFQVLIDPDRLRANRVSIDEVMKAAGDASSLETGGFFDTPNQRLAIRHSTPLSSPEELGAALVAVRDGAPVRLRDVADVRIGYPPPIGDAIIASKREGGVGESKPGLLLIVEKHPDGNTLDVTRSVDRALEELEPALGGVNVDRAIFRPATFIERALNNLTHSLLVGCGLVAVILIAFLFDWRTAFISMLAIPLSLVAAVLVITWAGFTVNTMVLAGLVIALGELVDDAIIDIENIVRRQRLNLEAGSPRSAFQVVVDASLEVRGAVVYATLIVVLVFLPVFFLGGLAGAFFRPLALAYILAVLASLIVALTVTPALAYIMLMGRTEARPEAPLTVWLKALYRPILPFFLERPWLCLAGTLAAFVLTGVAYWRLGQEFLPHFQETDFLMHFVEKPGTGLDAMRELTKDASQNLMKVKGVRNFGSHIGRAEVADEVVGPNFTELWISIDEEADYKATVKEIEAVVGAYPGLYRDVLTYLRERIKEVLTGASAAVVVRLYGPDLDVLRYKAQEVEAAIKDVPGVKNLKVEQQVLVPQVEVRLKPGAAARFGVTAGHVRRASSAFLRGTKAGEVYEGQKKFDVVVWGVPSVRADLAALRALPVDTPLAGQVRLGDVAEVLIVPAPNLIQRENASRRLDITCNVEGRDLGAVARDIEAKVKEVQFPQEYHPELLGEYAERQASSWQLFVLGILAVVGVILVLYADFRAWRPTLLVAVTIPFALIGGVAAVFVSGGVLSLGSIVGFVTVLGIAARNGILMVSHFRHLEAEEGVPFGKDLVMQGAEERLSPILMTALCTGLALVPLVIAGNKPGHEIEYPLAVVILGGLVTSTVLNLFVVPPLYLMFGHSPPSNEEA
jgi:CzcA family heavy metal efflux pump